MAVASELAYNVIRKGILAGEFVEGQPLRETELSGRFGVSRTPVREALRRLAAEGLVVGEPHKGVVVARLSEEQVQELFSLRSMLEGHAAGRAADRIDDAGLDRLRKLAVAMESLVAERGEAAMREVAELNTEFHELLFSFAASEQLIMFISILNHMPLTERTFLRYTAEGVQKSLQCHRQLLDALSAHDVEWAETAMRNHIFSARDMYLSGQAKAIW